MRVVRHITLVLLYVMVTVGMTVATHFCGGEPVSSSLLGGTERRAGCCCGDEGQMDGCCSTSIATLRVDDVHTVSGESLFVPLHVEQVLAPADRLLPASPHVSVAGLVRPPGSSVPTRLLTCSLLI
jgi:hypothetical protein